MVGFAHGEDDKVFNAAAVIADRQLMGIYHKIELPIMAYSMKSAIFILEPAV